MLARCTSLSDKVQSGWNMMECVCLSSTAEFGDSVALIYTDQLILSRRTELSSLLASNYN